MGFQDRARNSRGEHPKWTRIFREKWKGDWNPHWKAISAIPKPVEASISPARSNRSFQTRLLQFGGSQKVRILY